MRDLPIISGARVKARREELGLSLRELARRVGLKAQSLGPIEKGRVLRTSALPDLARELHVSPDWLAGREPPAPAAEPEAPAPPARALDPRLERVLQVLTPDEMEEAIRLLRELALRGAGPQH